MPTAELVVVASRRDLPTRGLHFAETDGKTVWVVDGWQHGTQGLLRLLHELEHVADMKAPHHSVLHFCVRSKVPWRQYKHSTLPLALAAMFRRDGAVTW